MNHFHRLLHRLMLSTTNRGLLDRGLFELLDLARGLIKRISDPLVPYELDGTRLLLPFSHELPFIRRAAPQYSSNVARLARLVAEKHEKATLIDIGANVGDTAAIVRRLTDIPILCVEGDTHYFDILVRNVRQAGLHDIETVCAFVGSSTETIRAVSVISSGTGRLVETGAEGVQTQVKRLSDILAEHPRFAQLKLLKVDTDGYDCRILRSELDLLAARKPALFFEYDPHFLRQSNDTGIDIFPSLRQAGYGPTLVYENNGDYLLSLDLADADVVEDLHKFYSGRRGHRYMDLCVFHSQDADLCQKARRDEIAFFEQFRSQAA